MFRRLFEEYGLPQFIRTDNGVPFATNTLARLSRLSAWWVRLGVLPQLIEPGNPQQNGRHERMHRTLKAEATRPAAAAMRSQQMRFDHFQRKFNSCPRMKVSPMSSTAQSTAFHLAAFGSQSSIGFPSGSCNFANRPFG